MLKYRAMTGKDKYTEAAALDTLKTVFGFQAFRPNQESIIQNIVIFSLLGIYLYLIELLLAIKYLC